MLVDRLRAALGRLNPGVPPDAICSAIDELTRDRLTRPAPELGAEERDEVKKVARELLARLKELLVLNWRQKAAARSALRLAIEDALDSGLPRAYTPELYRQKCSAVFEHVYDSYPERNAGVYAQVSV